MRVTPINMAEAVIEPFWDPQLCGLREWAIEPGEEHGLSVSQNWCWVQFSWVRPPGRGPALRMSRAADLDLAGYDELLLSVMAPEGSVVRIVARTDKGEAALEAPPAPVLKKEHALPLGGAARLKGLTIEVHHPPGAQGVQAGWFNWIGLRNSALMPRLEGEWRRFDARWEGYVQPEGFEPSFRLAHGLLIDEAELAQLRAEHEGWLAEHGQTPFTRAAEAARQGVPEEMVGEFVNFWGDTRYNRERDHGKLLLGRGPAAALAGLLLRDADLLRLGARYAMALASCGHWDDGMICRFPGSAFEHRAFVQSLCTYDAALLLDLAGEMFTPLGRELLMRRIAEEGLGCIHFNAWKFEYIWHCNQLAWFTPGRMIGCLLLERSWPRVRPCTEMALGDLVESLGYAVLPDGGYAEGPTYFTCVGRSGGLPLYLYAKARGREFRDVIPECMRRTADFGAAVASTADDQDVIPICDAGVTLDQETLSVMAAALPESQWPALLRKAVRRAGGMPDSLLAWKLLRLAPAESPDPPAFVALPQMGIMASTRRLGAGWVKLMLMGNMAGAGHTHEDKGSFVLEAAGEVLAVDPGTCSYSSPLAGLVKNCERHNMLVPTGTAERPHPRCPLPADVRPAGRGDATAFHASIDATPGWEGYYRRWVRTWDSPAPDGLVIRDEYELERGDGVEFYWNTRLDAELDGRLVRLIGRRVRAEITAPEGCEARIDELPLYGGGVQRRITFRRPGRAGALEVRCRLSLAEGAGG
jgi:hypothetical protein